MIDKLIRHIYFYDSSVPEIKEMDFCDDQRYTIERAFVLESGLVEIENHFREKFKEEQKKSKNAAVDYAIQELWQAGKKIAAIKFYRWINSVGLKDAKDYVENLCKDIQVNDYARMMTFQQAYEERNK